MHLEFGWTDKCENHWGADGVERHGCSGIMRSEGVLRGQRAATWHKMPWAERAWHGRGRLERRMERTRQHRDKIQERVAATEPGGEFHNEEATRAHRTCPRAAAKSGCRVLWGPQASPSPGHKHTERVLRTSESTWAYGPGSRHPPPSTSLPSPSQGQHQHRGKKDSTSLRGWGPRDEGTGHPEP